MVYSELHLMRDILRALSKGLARLFRNNVGVAKYDDGSKVVYGLCKGSSDLIGWRSVTVTQDMVGKKIAIFSAVEVKSKTGRTTGMQDNFLRVVREAGGYAGVARTVEQAAAILNVSIEDIVNANNKIRNSRRANSSATDIGAGKTGQGISA